MKKRFCIIALMALSLIACTDGLQKSINELEDKYAELEGRVSRLEELCKEMNTNISSLKTLVSVILNNDYIVSVAPITKEGAEVGYTITFAIHDPITIYHGQNGIDGQDGKDGDDGKDGEDGKDGTTPLIGVALDTSDNAYYWTLNGTWLLDADGNRIPLSSRDGKDGKDGEDGKDGQDGQDGHDGADGITPQLKIQDNYWYVSTDNGATWTKLGKATGEDGKDGKDGQDGKDGDDMFSSVTQDDNFVYFTLANGTVLTVSKYKDETVKIVDGAIMAPYSVSATKKVYFSQGNLLKKDVSEGVEYWFVEDQAAQMGSSFNWASTLGKDIAILNGGGLTNIWRLPTQSEWEYICAHSPYIKATVYSADSSTGHTGTVIFPDNYQPVAVLRNVNYIISSALWEEWQKHGVIFFPGVAGNLSVNDKYWLSTYNGYGVYYIRYSSEGELIASLLQSTSGELGYARLIKNAQ